ncbi:MAG: hypothetical protein NZ853_08540 [Leptospiraceae bacterium]|nr:hypothetical protein [Leptospiraceae bacterium]MDW7976776.1 hypothetical protein [Leptospiraceae bacterium]
MSELYIRVWEKVDLKEITKHLMIIDDFYGMCANCKEVGLNFVKHTKCPKCNTEFFYLAPKNKGEIGKILNRIQIEKLPFKVIEKEDWEKAISRQQMDSVFK